MPTRRQVLRAAGGAMTIVLGGLQISCTRQEAARIDASQLSDEQFLSLVGITQRLYPHENLNSVVYRDAVLRLVDSIHDSRDRREMVVTGLSALDAGTPWLDLPVAQQIAALVEIEDGPFFGLILSSTRGRLYSDERTWTMLGYGGDASKFGGYVDRGFNDIDWLPDAKDAD